jgi:hypothetical protein
VNPSTQQSTNAQAFGGATGLSMRRIMLILLLLVALITPSPPADAAETVGQFVVRCRYSHTLADDPIVFPDQPGASHLHDFFGNTSVDAFSTVDSLLASDTTCRASSDTAGYWAPTAFMNGQQLKPTVMRIYYLGNRGQPVETIPAGLKIIGGNRDALSPVENPHVRWYCGETRSVKTPRRDAPYDCSPWSQYGFVDGVIAIIDLPNCWDGVGLEPENVAYPVDGSCPATFPHTLPRLSERIHYGVMNPVNPDGSIGFILSSGPFWSMHADFWNAWQQARLDELVDSCLVAAVHCGSIDSSASLDWVREFGTSRYDLGYAAAAGRDGPYVAGFTNYELPRQTYRRRSDVFVRAYDVAGDVRWTRQFGSSGIDHALAMTAAGDRVYVAGFTDGRLPGQTARGGTDAFAAGFTASGKLEWLLQFGSRTDEQATGIAAGSTAVYVGGWTDGALTRGVRSGGRDAWLVKLSPAGAILWTREFGSPETDEIRALTVRETQVVAAGWTDGSLPGQTSQGGSDAFVREYGADGRVDWTRQFGTSGNDVATAVAGFERQVFAAGVTDAAFLNQQPAGGLDTFVRAMDADGAVAWTDQFGTPGDDETASIAVRLKGLYVVGSTLGALTESGLLGETDVFARRYLRKGAEIWTMQLGTIDYDRAYGVALDARSLYVTGTTHGAFEGETNAGDRDVFLLRVRFT